MYERVYVYVCIYIYIMYVLMCGHVCMHACIRLAFMHAHKCVFMLYMHLCNQSSMHDWPPACGCLSACLPAYLPVFLCACLLTNASFLLTGVCMTRLTTIGFTHAKSGKCHHCDSSSSDKHVDGVNEHEKDDGTDGDNIVVVDDDAGGDDYNDDPFMMMMLTIMVIMAIVLSLPLG